MGRKRDIRKELVLQTGDESLLFADGFDSCIVGYAMQDGVFKVVYNKSKMLLEMAKTMSFEEADEYFAFNIQSTYVGERTPIYMEPLVKHQVDRQA